jgi:hypothetical protein
MNYDALWHRYSRLRKRNGQPPAYIRIHCAQAPGKRTYAKTELDGSAHCCCCGKPVAVVW